jgi:predicted dienelactone hydrolase
VAIWKPAGTAPLGGYPLVLFSHGFTGCDTQSIFLMEALAEAGYFVLAPNHHDAVCGSAGRTEAWYPGKLFDKLASTRAEPPFGDASQWSEVTYQDRRADFEAILEVVLRDHAFQGTPLDSQRIGIAGHSLGGYTALGMAGAWPSWKDRRIKAVLALSPYCDPYVKKGDLGHIDVPVMYQGGTRDLGITPTVRRLQGAYDLSSTPKYYVEFSGAGHFAWTNLNKEYQSIITSYSVAFFNRYLKGMNDPDPLATLVGSPLPPKVSSVRAAPE